MQQHRLERLRQVMSPRLLGPWKGGKAMPVPPVTVRDFERRLLQAELPVLVFYSWPLRLLTDTDALALFRQASELAEELYWHLIGSVAVVRAAWDGSLDPDLPLF